MDVIVRHLSKTFRSGFEEKLILKDVTFEVKSGEWVNIIGRSGSGKTTLLKCLAGLLRTEEGASIFIGGSPIHQTPEEKLREFRRKHIGFIYQDFQLFQAFTAKQNVMLPEWPYTNRKKLEKRAEELLERLQLTDRTDAVPAQLSGGEQQRIAIARALLNDPEVLLCDEPTGNLDRKTRDEILGILHNCREEGKTILFVTHDYEVLKYGQRIFQIDDGVITEIDKPAIPG